MPYGTIICGNVKMNRPLTSAQIRAARALIRWTAEDLARQSASALRTIRRAELADGETSMTAANDLAVRRALEAAGVEFIDENGSGPGSACERRNNTENANNIGRPENAGGNQARVPSIAPRAFEPHRQRDRRHPRVCGRTALRRLRSNTIGCCIIPACRNRGPSGGGLFQFARLGSICWLPASKRRLPRSRPNFRCRPRNCSITIGLYGSSCEVEALNATAGGYYGQRPCCLR